MTSRLEGKVAIVTGGARGIGRAISGRLAEEGAAVTVFSRHEEAAADAALAIERAGGNVLALAGDVSVEADVRRSVVETVRHFGRLDVMVNNAGVIELDSALETSVPALGSALRG
jgi:3-oxoacyl-[acyl-carrier protein] reductase